MSEGGSRSFFYSMIFGALLFIIDGILTAIVMAFENVYSLRGLIDALSLLCFPLLILFAGLLIIFSNISNVISPTKHYFCPKCQRPLAFDAAYKIWFCHNCKKRWEAKQLEMGMEID